MEVVGRHEKPPVRPWLEGHEAKLRQLDSAITECRCMDCEALAPSRPWPVQPTTHATATRRDLNAARRQDTGST